MEAEIPLHHDVLEQNVFINLVNRIECLERDNVEKADVIKKLTSEIDGLTDMLVSQQTLIMKSDEKISQMMVETKKIEEKSKYTFQRQLKPMCVSMKELIEQLRKDVIERGDDLDMSVDKLSEYVDKLSERVEKIEEKQQKDNESKEQEIEEIREQGTSSEKFVLGKIREVNEKLAKNETKLIQQLNLKDEQNLLELNNLKEEFEHSNQKEVNYLNYLNQQIENIKMMLEEEKQLDEENTIQIQRNADNILNISNDTQKLVSFIFEMVVDVIKLNEIIVNSIDYLKQKRIEDTRIIGKLKEKIESHMKDLGSVVAKIKEKQEESLEIITQSEELLGMIITNNDKNYVSIQNTTQTINQLFGLVNNAKVDIEKNVLRDIEIIWKDIYQREIDKCGCIGTYYDQFKKWHGLSIPRVLCSTKNISSIDLDSFNSLILNKPNIMIVVETPKHIFGCFNSLELLLQPEKAAKTHNDCEAIKNDNKHFIFIINKFGDNFQQNMCLENKANPSLGVYSPKSQDHIITCYNFFEIKRKSCKMLPYDNYYKNCHFAFANEPRLKVIRLSVISWF